MGISIRLSKTNIVMLATIVLVFYGSGWLRTRCVAGAENEP